MRDLNPKSISTQVRPAGCRIQAASSSRTPAKCMCLQPPLLACSLHAAVALKLIRHAHAPCVPPALPVRQELYGYVNMATREWKDGLLSCTMRDLANMPDDNPKWIILDGDLGGARAEGGAEIVPDCTAPQAAGVVNSNAGAARASCPVLSCSSGKASHKCLPLAAPQMPTGSRAPTL